MRLRALTYNIRSGTDIFGRPRLNEQAEVIRSQAADLVLLQEVSSREQGQRLGSLVKLPHVAFGAARATSMGEFGNVLLCRWPLEHVENHAVAARWPIGQTRSVLAATMIAEGRRIHAIVAHFGLLPGEPELSVRMVLSVAAARDGALIVGGDFNRPLPGAACHGWLRGVLVDSAGEHSGRRSRRFLLSGRSSGWTTCTFVGCWYKGITNRIRALLATYWPALERAMDDRLDTIGGTVLLKHYPSAPQIRRAGLRRVVKLLRATQRVHAPEAWVWKLVVAAKAQTVVVAGADTAADLVAELADQLYRVLDRRQRLEKEIERAFFNLPEASILKSLPGIGPRLGARILIEIGDIRQFRTSAQLAAYAGLGPTPHQSGTSIRGNRPTRFGNHRLKNAFYLAALSSLKHPPSRVYYDRKREQGKRHTQALLCLARRRVDVLHAMLTTNTHYRVPTPQPDIASAA